MGANRPSCKFSPGTCGHRCCCFSIVDLRLCCYGAVLQLGTQVPTWGCSSTNQVILWSCRPLIFVTKPWLHLDQNLAPLALVFLVFNLLWCLWTEQTEDQDVWLILSHSAGPWKALPTFHSTQSYQLCFVKLALDKARENSQEFMAPFSSLLRSFLLDFEWWRRVLVVFPFFSAHRGTHDGRSWHRSIERQRWRVFLAIKLLLGSRVGRSFCS